MTDKEPANSPKMEPSAGKAITDTLMGRDRTLSRKLATEYVLTDLDKEILAMVNDDFPKMPNRSND